MDGRGSERRATDPWAEARGYTLWLTFGNYLERIPRSNRSRGSFRGFRSFILWLGGEGIFLGVRCSYWTYSEVL